MPRYPRPRNSPYIPDATGDRWYIVMGVPGALLATYRNLVTAAEVALARPGGGARATSIAIDLLITDMQARVDAAAAKAALTASSRAVAQVQATAVRPDTATAVSKGTKLASSISARPILLPGFTLRGLGAVGVGNVGELEAGTINPFVNSDKGYWQAQEDGSSHLVGKTLYGVFMPGDSQPSGALFRVHPVFEYRTKGSTPRFKMVVNKPIQPRHFLKDGAGDGYALRKKEFAAIQAYAVTRMRTIRTGNDSLLGRASKGLRRR